MTFLKAGRSKSSVLGVQRVEPAASGRWPHRCSRPASSDPPRCSRRVVPLRHRHEAESEPDVGRFLMRCMVRRRPPRSMHLTCGRYGSRSSSLPRPTFASSSATGRCTPCRCCPVRRCARWGWAWPSSVHGPAPSRHCSPASLPKRPSFDVLRIPVDLLVERHQPVAIGARAHVPTSPRGVGGGESQRQQKDRYARHRTCDP